MEDYIFVTKMEIEINFNSLVSILEIAALDLVTFVKTKCS